ncbi:MAG: tol-pal system-associated acyl-CoA thioesterase [Pseudomonadota bacterium]
MTPHFLPCRIYYEDTDLQGIVYYANYFKFIERGRTEALTALGIDQMVLLETHRVMFVVRRVEADYHQPARFGDDLLIRTQIASVGAASLVMEQGVYRGDTLLFAAIVKIAVIDGSGKPARMPAALRQKLLEGV